MKYTLATDFTIVLEDKPGSLAELGDALGKEGVNIEGICAFINEGRGVVHIVASDAEKSRAILESHGVDLVSERPVLVLDIEDRPGAMGELTSRFADRQTNLELLYLATQTRLVVGANDIEKAKAVLQ